MPSKLRAHSGLRISFFAFQDIVTSVTGILILMTLILTLYLNSSALLSEMAALEPTPLQRKLAQALEQVGRLNAQNEALQQNLATAAATPDTNRLQADIETLQQQITRASSSLTRAQTRLTEQQQAEREKETTLGLADLGQHAEEIKQEIQTLRQTNQAAQVEIKDLEKRNQQIEAKAEKARQGAPKLWLVPEADVSGKEPLLVTVSGAKIVCERFDKPEARKEMPAAEGDRLFADFLNGLQPAKDYLVFYVRPSGIGLFKRCRSTARNAGFDVGYDAVEENKQIQFTRPREL
ncbi:MAG: hypothetical protein HY674_20765 [Chloroflexi bacterium]|nr:hypothetical protein [Chloroflexota bacterium]